MLEKVTGSKAASTPVTTAVSIWSALGINGGANFQINSRKAVLNLSKTVGFSMNLVRFVEFLVR